jgi:hypothetical protein
MSSCICWESICQWGGFYQRTRSCLDLVQSEQLFYRRLGDGGSTLWVGDGSHAPFGGLVVAKLFVAAGAGELDAV